MMKEIFCSISFILSVLIPVCAYVNFGDQGPKKLIHTKTSPIERYSFPSYYPYNTENIHFAILGGGAFSLALAKVLSYKNIKSTMLVRNQTVADCINLSRRHPKYLIESDLPGTLSATADPKEALKNANYVVHAVPMQQSRDFLIQTKQYLSPNVPILSVTKGVEQGTFSLMNDIISQTLGTSYQTAYLSGPSFALEIMNGQATAVVIASADDTLASELALILSCQQFRCHTSRDVKVDLL